MDCKNLRYCVFDLETTGLNLKTSKIVQIAFKIVIRNKIVAKENVYIYPTNIDWEDDKVKEALAINHLSKDFLKDNGHDETKVISEFYRLVEFYGVDFICGQNISNYDLPLINNILPLTDYIKNCRMIDTKIISYIHDTGISNHSLSELAKIYKIPQKKAHCAENDVYVTERVMRAQIRKIDIAQRITPFVKDIFYIADNKDNPVWTKKKYCCMRISDIARVDTWYTNKHISPSGENKIEQAPVNYDKICENIVDSTSAELTVNNMVNYGIKAVKRIVKINN